MKVKDLFNGYSYSQVYGKAREKMEGESSFTKYLLSAYHVEIFIP